MIFYVYNSWKLDLLAGYWLAFGSPAQNEIKWSPLKHLVKNLPSGYRSERTVTDRGYKLMNF